MQSESDFPTDLRALESDYELIRELGQGGMAAVYLARRRDSGALVAIKAVRARCFENEWGVFHRRNVLLINSRKKAPAHIENAKTEG